MWARCSMTETILPKLSRPSPKWSNSIQRWARRGAFWASARLKPGTIPPRWRTSKKDTNSVRRRCRTIAKVADYHLALLLIRTAILTQRRSCCRRNSYMARSPTRSRLPSAWHCSGFRFWRTKSIPPKDAVVATAGSIAVLLAQNQRGEAVQSMQQAIKDYPDIPNLRSAYAAMTQPATAAVQPPNAGELAQTARLFARSTTVAKAGDASTSAGSSSANFDDLAKRAVAARDAGNTDAAIRDYQGALQLRPTWEEGWWDLSLIFFSNARYSEAIGSAQACG